MPTFENSNSTILSSLFDVIRAVEKEDVIYKQLKLDVYFCDMSAILISVSKVDYMYFNDDLSTADANDKEKKKKAMGKRKQQERLLLLLIDEGLELATLMLVYFSTAFVTLPTELIQITAFLIIGLVNTVTESINAKVHPQFNSRKPNKVFSFLIDTARSRARLSRDQIVWCMEFMIIALPDISGQLNSNSTMSSSLEWLQKKKNGVSEIVSNVDFLSIERIIAYVRELIHLWMVAESSHDQQHLQSHNPSEMPNQEMLNQSFSLYGYSNYAPYMMQRPQYHESNAFGVGNIQYLNQPPKPPNESFG